MFSEGTTIEQSRLEKPVPLPKFRIELDLGNLGFVALY